MQVDHIEPHGKGGKTAARNARNTHPFCNNNRPKIEQVSSGTLMLELPAFNDKEQLVQQLSFLDFFDDATEMDEDPDIPLSQEDDEITDNDDEENN